MRARPGVRTGVAFTTAALLLPAACSAQSCPPAPRTVQGSQAAPLADVRWLAADALEGRAAGSEGGRCAAEYLGASFAAIGLEPAGSGGEWRQPFALRVGAELAGTNRLAVAGRTLELGRAWSPYGFAASGVIEGPLLYGGSGVARPGGERPVPVSGRIVVLEKETPGASGVYADPHFKATIASRRGARAVVVLGRDGLPRLQDETRASLAAPVVAIAGSAAAAFRAAAGAGAGASIEVSVRPRTAEVANVIGLLPGSDPVLRDEVVIVGAHFDHLGRGGEGSRAAGSSEIHNGADDNASGTAALLEVARRVSEGARPARSILFIAFDAEERGLLGSEHYVDEPVRPLARTVAMLNLDMVGRLGSGPLTVLGMGSATGWDVILKAANAVLFPRLPLRAVADSRGSSDHTPFEARGVPALHFFTGTHEDYHLPSDDWERIDAEGLERVAALVAELTVRIAGGGGDAPMTPAPPEPR